MAEGIMTNEDIGNCFTDSLESLEDCIEDATIELDELTSGFTRPSDESLKEAREMYRQDKMDKRAEQMDKRSERLERHHLEDHHHGDERQDSRRNGRQDFSRSNDKQERRNDGRQNDRNNGRGRQADDRFNRFGNF